MVLFDKVHGGVSLKDVKDENLRALREGAANLRHHVNNVSKFGINCVGMKQSYCY